MACCSQEDAHLVDLHIDSQGTAMFGVFDGHAGQEVAEYASRHLVSGRDTQRHLLTLLLHSYYEWLRLSNQLHFSSSQTSSHADGTIER